MSVRVAEIQAHTTARPVHTALQRNAGSSQMRLPCCKFPARDGKADVQRAAAVVWRNGTAGGWTGLGRAAFAEQQEDLPAGDAQAAHALIAQEELKAQDALEELLRAVEIRDVKRGLQDMA